jgi:hypothetical protein
VTVDAGGIPTVATPPQAVLLAETYRALKASVYAAIDARFGRVIAAKCAGEYLSGSAYAMYLEGTTLRRAAYAAAELRTHWTRNKKLTGILAQVKKVGI